MAIVAGAGIAAVGSVAASSISASGASNAAKTQANAANSAEAEQQYMFDTTQNNLQPYMQTGQLANTALQNATGLNSDNPLASSLLSPITMNEPQLQQTPGYQFNQTQGLKATQNAAAARGLGVSGAALKGAATYATGLADNTYQNQFNNAVTNQTNQFNRLQGLAAGGQNAAAGLGGIATNTGANIASTISGAGNAIAGSQIAGSNALASGLSGAANNIGAGIYGNSGNAFNSPSSYDQYAQDNNFQNYSFNNGGTGDFSSLGNIF